MNQLLQSIKNAKSLKINYGITGQKIIKEEMKKTITFSSNISIIVDYILKVASVETTISDFTASTTKKDMYENYIKTSIETDLNTKVEKYSTEDLLNEEYDNLFKPGGLLYPIELEELIPVESKMNNDNCQVCCPCKDLMDNTSGYLESAYVIYKKDENLYDITRVMRQEDMETKMPLMQYCNTKIEVLS